MSLKDLRHQAGLTQQQLSDRAGVPRTTVGAIESGHMEPTVLSALRLARALGRTVEDLFGGARVSNEQTLWMAPPTEGGRFWRAIVAGREVAYPVEPSPLGLLGDDGVARDGEVEWHTSDADAGQTLVVSSCDPSSSILAEELRDRHGIRMILLMRGSGAALRLLEGNRVHAAGIHFAGDDGEANLAAAREALRERAALLTTAVWEEGLALAPSVAAETLADVVQGNYRWVGREEGAAARKCCENLFAEFGLGLPEGFSHPVSSHRTVAEVIRAGMAEVGPCVRLAAAEAGLRFLRIRNERHDLVIPVRYMDDPRLMALRDVVQSPRYRRRLAALPGYESGLTGEWRYA